MSKRVAWLVVSVGRGRVRAVGATRSEARGLKSEQRMYGYECRVVPAHYEWPQPKRRTK